MIHYEKTLDIDAAPDAVWNIISRYMHIDEIAPQIRSVEALTVGENGVGSKRRCHFENGGSLVEEVIAWTENRGYKVRLSEMDSMPLHEATAGLFLEPIGGGRTKVVWSMDYRVKFGPFGWLLGQTMMKMMMGKVLDGNLNALASNFQSKQALAI